MQPRDKIKMLRQLPIEFQSIDFSEKIRTIGIYLGREIENRQQVFIIEFLQDTRAKRSEPQVVFCHDLEGLFDEFADEYFNLLLNFLRKAYGFKVTFELVGHFLLSRT